VIDITFSRGRRGWPRAKTRPVRRFLFGHGPAALSAGGAARFLARPDTIGSFRSRPEAPMGKHTAELLWTRGDQAFLDNRYSRLHSAHFDGGVTVPLSSSPDVVPVPMSDASAVDPEEAFVASLASCHMLWFLGLAARRGWRVDSYRDAAVGTMGRDERNRIVMREVLLRPRVDFSGERLPTREQIEQLHHDAHAECFLAHSVRCEMRCEPVFD
jgi:organic hydroperoxide reductase OsmC/OhrA